MFSPKTIIYEFPIEKLIAHYKNCYKIDVTEKSLRHKFSHICDETKNEGFFANKVLIIEGDTEKYALPLYFSHAGFDVDNERVAIISAGSVDNITYLYAVFNEFHIPCYIIFDGDKPTAGEFEKIKETEKSKEGDNLRKKIKNKSKRNKDLLEFVGEKVDGAEFVFPETAVMDKHAVWEKDFEEAFHKPIDIYAELKGAATDLYRTTSKPLAGRFIASELVEKHPEKISSLVPVLIDKINKCEWTCSCLVQKT